MAHEPIRLGNDDWPTSRKLVEYELNRAAQNIHDLRGQIQHDAHRLAERREEERQRIAEQREEDARCLASSISPLLVRLSVVEARVVMYAALGGALGMGLLQGLMMFLKK